MAPGIVVHRGNRARVDRFGDDIPDLFDAGVTVLPSGLRLRKLSCWPWKARVTVIQSGSCGVPVEDLLRADGWEMTPTVVGTPFWMDDSMSMSRPEFADEIGEYDLCDGIIDASF
jgi:hypothetical protein